MKPRLLRLLAALTLGAIAPAAAEAKLVELRWTEVPGAASYELEIQTTPGNPKPPKVLKLEKAWWKGDLGFGAYTFRVRAVDKIARGGQWSPDSPLVVTPPGAEPASPEDGRKLSYFGNQAPAVQLGWRAVPGVQRYRVEVSRGKQVVLNLAARGTTVKLPEVSEGEYRWRVASLVDIPEIPAFAPVQMREWQSRFGDDSTLEIERQTLGQPELTYPLGRQTAPKSGGLLSFEWKPIPGATKYEIVLEEDTPREPGRGPASAAEPLYATVVNGDTHRIAIPPPKSDRNYRWKVRAFAGQEAGPESLAAFTLDAPARFTPRSGKVRVAPSYYPFTMTFADQTRVGTLDGTALATSFYFQYWQWERFGASIALEQQQFGVAGSQFLRLGFDAYASARFSLGFLSAAGRFWSSQLHAGYGYHEFFDLDYIPVNSGREVLLSTHGATARMEVEGDITEKLGFSGLASIFFPSSVDGDSATGSRLSFGGEVNYLVWKTWRLGLGAQLDKLTINYNRNGASRTVGLNGFRISLGLTYGFGGDHAASNSTAFVSKTEKAATPTPAPNEKTPTRTPAASK